MIIVLILGLGTIMIVSAVENSKLVDTLRAILANKPTPTNTDTATASALSVGSSPGSGAISSPLLDVPQSPTPSTTGLGVLATPEAWVKFRTTQAHGVNGETGIDIGTPYHTDITNLIPGTVSRIDYGPYGGEVWVQFQEGGKVLYANYLHLDEVLVAIGQRVSGGEPLGLSGGQLGYGLHPARLPYSSGPHTEFGIYTSEYGGARNALNPTGLIDYLRGLLGG